MESFGYLPRTLNATSITASTINAKPVSVLYVGRLVLGPASTVGVYNFKLQDDPLTNLTIPAGKVVRRVDYVVKTAVAPGTAALTLGTTAHPAAFNAAATATDEYTTTGVVMAADITGAAPFTVSATADEAVSSTTTIDTITAGEIFIYVYVDNE
jgi:hypothetical protein